MASNGQLKPANQTEAQIRAEIERAREQIHSSVAALKQEVAVVTDWREWVRARPLFCIGAAVAAGFYLGYRR